MCCIALLLHQSADARVWLVGPNQSIMRIQDALLQSEAGDTIRVFPGHYREKNLKITKPLTLEGIDYPLLDGEHQHEIISITSSHVIVRGFRLQNSGVSSIVDYAAIKVYDTRLVVITNNILINCFFGIYLQNSRLCIISHNQLHASAIEEQQSGNGIHAWKSDSLLIRNNQVTGHRDGIYFEFVTQSFIIGNHTFRNLRYGLHFMFSNNDAYAHNVFEQNGAGVAVMYSNHVRMVRNYFRENWGDASYGLLLKEISDSDIEGNVFERNTSGVFVEGASRMRVKYNQFLRNGWALKVQSSCMELRLEANNFLGNTFDLGTNGTLMLNTFQHNYWDKYEGYDINRDGTGDVPHRPVSLYSMIVERNPPAMMLFRSFMVALLDRTEKMIPSITPEAMKDDLPRMKPLAL